MTNSVIDFETRAAYEAALYHVEAEPRVTLRPKQPCFELAKLFTAAGVETAAFVTACNPFSQLLSDRENTDRQQKLENDLATQGYRVVPGIGADPLGKWPGEPSVLVLGMDLETARQIGLRLEQNAILWIPASLIPQVELLR